MWEADPAGFSSALTTDWDWEDWQSSQSLSSSEWDASECAWRRACEGEWAFFEDGGASAGRARRHLQGLRDADAAYF